MTGGLDGSQMTPELKHCLAAALRPYGGVQEGRLPINVRR